LINLFFRTLIFFKLQFFLITIFGGQDSLIGYS